MDDFHLVLRLLPERCERFGERRKKATDCLEHFMDNVEHSMCVVKYFVDVLDNSANNADYKKRTKQRKRKTEI
jgi:hypothetical protein